ncbi:8304_t:CDS:2 [Dentiscutata erythropus]|uniref:8304_t:CDS:1 n=1 Tax=Dentiscutata erythropus TaxID=1348616 RepID=A0A9N9D136_9GLOM|nr:8304_t:CDS:2 [Dentiscutata erythropus]
MGFPNLGMCSSFKAWRFFDLRDKQWDSLIQECIRDLKPGTMGFSDSGMRSSSKAWGVFDLRDKEWDSLIRECVRVLSGIP